jgi:hypothetical protein
VRAPGSGGSRGGGRSVQRAHEEAGTAVVAPTDELALAARVMGVLLAAYHPDSQMFLGPAVRNRHSAGIYR